MAGSRPLWSRTGTTSTTPAVVFLPRGVNEVKVWVDVLSFVGIGSTYAAPAVTGVDEVFTLDTAGTPTGGSFTLRLNGVATSALTFDESAADVKTALVATSQAATGDITAAGGALPTAITLTFTGIYAASPDVPLELGTNSLTGGTSSIVTLLRTTAGKKPYAYLEAESQESFQLGDPDSAAGTARYLYVATVASTGNYRVSGFRNV